MEQTVEWLRWVMLFALAYTVELFFDLVEFKSTHHSKNITFEWYFLNAYSEKRVEFDNIIITTIPLSYSAFTLDVKQHKATKN